MLSVSIIIPTYNEAQNIPSLIEELFASLNREQIDAEVIIVDDNSPDGTGKVAEEMSQRYPVTIIHRSGKLGLGSAVIKGFKASERPLVGVMDADLSHDPSILNSLINSLRNNDIAIGSRFEPESTVENWLWWRKIISQIGIILARLLTRVHDPLSGYFFLRKEVISGLDLETTGYKILLEILVKGYYANVKQIPFRFRIRQHSTSKLSSKEYWLFGKQLLTYAWYKYFHYARTPRS